MQVRATDMMSVLLYVLTALAAVSMPVLYLLEWKYGRGKWSKAVHLILAMAGFVLLLLDVILFDAKVESAADNVRTWAGDFFHGYANVAVPAVLWFTGILAVANLIDHKMRRIRMALMIIFPVIMIAATFFVASLASDGQFAVDLYIRWLAPGLGLLPHIVPLCERRKKSD